MLHDDQILNLTASIQNSLKNIELKKGSIKQLEDFLEKLKNDKENLSTEQLNALPEIEQNIQKLYDIVNKAEKELQETLKDLNLEIFYDVAKTMNSFGF